MQSIIDEIIIDDEQQEEPKQQQYSPINNEASISPEVQRFFAFSKRVPKNVKRYCGICRQHGLLMETRGHICNYKNCNCSKCELVRSRRQVMSQQIRLRRAQDKRFQRTSDLTTADFIIPIGALAKQQLQLQQQHCLLENNNNSSFESDTTTTTSSSITIDDSSDNNLLKIFNSSEQRLSLTDDVKNLCYFCQKCKNHGLMIWKKMHKRECLYANCKCDQCDLIETRRKLDQHIKKRRSDWNKRPQNNNNNNNNNENNNKIRYILSNSNNKLSVNFPLETSPPSLSPPMAPQPLFPPTTLNNSLLNKPFYDQQTDDGLNSLWKNFKSSSTSPINKQQELNETISPFFKSQLNQPIITPEPNLYNNNNKILTLTDILSTLMFMLPPPTTKYLNNKTTEPQKQQNNNNNLETSIKQQQSFQNSNNFVVEQQQQNNNNIEITTTKQQQDGIFSSKPQQQFDIQSLLTRFLLNGEVAQQQQLSQQQIKLPSQQQQLLQQQQQLPPQQQPQLLQPTFNLNYLIQQQQLLSATPQQLLLTTQQQLPQPITINNYDQLNQFLAFSSMINQK